MSFEEKYRNEIYSKYAIVRPKKTKSFDVLFCFSVPIDEIIAVTVTLTTLEYVNTARCYCSQVGGVGFCLVLLFLLQLCQRFLLLWCLATFGECCESTLGSYRVLRFYQHKIYNYNTCSFVQVDAFIVDM